MTTFKRKLAQCVSAAVLSLGLAAGANAMEFSRSVVFGDSLSDGGAWSGFGLPIATGVFVPFGGNPGRFTTNPDQVWAQVLAGYYGLTADPAHLLRVTGPTPQSGTNLATGGARVSRQDCWPFCGNSSLTAAQQVQLASLIPSLTAQIDSYLRANPQLDPNALYTVWGGANDLFYYTAINTAALSNPATQAAAATAVVTQTAAEANNIVGLVRRLHNAGARYVLVLNLPDAGATPQARAAGLQTLWTTSSQQYNATLNAGLNTLSGNVIGINVYGLITEVLRNPGAYGFSNTTSTACVSRNPQTGFIEGPISSSLCSPNTLAATNAASAFVFADGVHPTGAAHRILADAVKATIDAPQQMAMLAETPLAASAAQMRGVDTRMRLVGKSGNRKVDVYASYDYSPQDFDRRANNPSTDTKNHGVTVGIDVSPAEGLIAGAAFGAGNSKADFGDGKGGFKTDTANVLFYGGLSLANFSLGAQVGLGALDFKDIRRTFMLGPVSRTETSRARGYQSMLKIGGSYALQFGNISTGPAINVTWQQVNVRSFSETGTNSTAMQFERQTRDSLISSIGWFGTMDIETGGARFKPFAQLAWEKDSKNDDREVRAHQIGMGGSFGLPAYKGDSDWWRLDLGASAQWANGLTGYAALGTQIDRKNSKSSSFTVGIRMPF